MPPRRGKRGSNAAPASKSDLKITSLDQNSLEAIIKCLARNEQADFASAHPVFSRTYRNMVETATNCGFTRNLESQSQILACYPNLLRLTVMLEIDNGGPSLYDLKGPPSVVHVHLAFRGGVPSRRSLSAIPTNFPNLRYLNLNHIYGPNREVSSKEKHVNSDGSLRVLSSLQNLEELSVKGLYSDDGLQHLTSLTKLTISFPSLSENYPDELYCHGCESIHLDDASDLHTYTRSIPWSLGIVHCKNIGALPKLKELQVDFNASEGNLSYSAVLNRLHLREPRRSGPGASRNNGNYNTLNDNIHSPPREPRYFQNLESIEFLRCGGPEHFLYTPTMHRRIQYPSEGLASNDLWHTCVIWESMKNFPKLQKWRLHAFDGGLDDVTEPLEVNWPCACGCGTVTGQLVEKEVECGCTVRSFVEIDRPEGL